MRQGVKSFVGAMVQREVLRRGGRRTSAGSRRQDSRHIFRSRNRIGLISGFAIYRDSPALYSFKNKCLQPLVMALGYNSLPEMAAQLPLFAIHMQVWIPRFASYRRPYFNRRIAQCCGGSSSIRINPLFILSKPSMHNCGTSSISWILSIRVSFASVSQ